MTAMYVAILLNLFLLIFLYINIQHKMIAITAHNVTEKIIISVTVDVLFVCTGKVYCVESLVCTVTLHCVESLTITNDKFLIIALNHFAFLLQCVSS